MKIIGLCSPFNGIGKTTLALALSHGHAGATIRGFADPFKELTEHALSEIGMDGMGKDNKFAFNGQVVTPRDLTIELARAVNRVLPGYPEYVMDIQCKKLSKMKTELLIIDDVRRKPEARFIKKRGGKIFRIHRENAKDARKCEIYELGVCDIDYDVDATDTAQAVRDILRVMGD